MIHLDIKLTKMPGGDAMTCLGECVKIAKAIDSIVYLDMESYSIAISKDCRVIDLYEIYRLN